ncbi:hypothetical protein EDD37DRAFT_646937 [Exophiala viscosa]|uniref:Uncharacterized protein n=1 Tax=Exophiala viscosa TaxID=2486360 RepID=A0AAN6E7B3_9EURO|nr:hypothetical protein EDD36DRAFT_22615 [Exophiala viscosa]KAI1627250.1 hypothetical protein EDD37DRAFT_646937 [Exophiala viscosa]
MMISSSPTTPNQLLALGVLGGFLLWGGMLFNGTLDALTLASETGTFPDGSSMRMAYTGWEVIDSNLRPLVAFFYVLTNESAGASRWTLFDASIVIRTINAWVLIESRRRGVRHPWLRHAIGFWFLQNSGGAALIAPVHLYFIARSKHTARDRTIPLNEARGFCPTIVVNALTTLLLFAPTWLDWPTHTHQGYISLFQLGPLMMTVAIVLFTRPGTSATVPETPKDPKNPNVDAPWVLAAYYMTGIAASIAHLYVVVVALTGMRGSELTISRLFRPSPRKVFSALPGSHEALKEGLHLFVQYDNMIAGAACLVFVHYMLQNIPKKNGSPTWKGREKSNIEFLYLLVASAVLGPAGAGSFGLAVREKRLRAELEEKK